MNFDFTEDQVRLRESVARVLCDTYGFEQRRAIVSGETGWSPAVWRQLSKVGVTGLRIAEDFGGFGGRAEDLLPILQEFGKSMLVEPFLASAVLGPTAVAQSGDAAACARLLPQVASGECILAWAHDEPRTRHAPAWVETRATRRSGRWVLQGVKCNVLHAPVARRIVVTARVKGEPGDRDGLGLFLLDAGATTLRLRPHRLHDDTLAAEMHLEEVQAEPLGDPGTAWPAIEATLEAGMAAVCADAVGAMEGAYQLTASYLNTRKQFGRLIGENQALRHRLAEMLVSLECCKSMAILAAIALDDPESTDRSDVMRAKLVIGRYGRQLCQSAVQLHGGIGMTEEYAVGHYLRRIVVMDQLFGDGSTQAARIAASEIRQAGQT